MKKILALLLVTVMLVSLFSGCQSTNSEAQAPRALCYVVSVHANFPFISIERFREDVYEVSRAYGSVGMVAVDGAPYVAADFKITAPDVYEDDARRSYVAEKNTEKILSALQSAKAKTPEVDTLAAIDLAADLLQDKEEPQKTMVVVDSMLSTTSLMNFAESNLIEQDASAIVAELESFHAIPDLSGIDVVLIGIGQTAGEQSALPSGAQYNLEQIWLAILEAANAKSVNVSSAPLGDALAKSTLEVSTVSFIADQFSFPASAPEEVPSQETVPPVPEVVRLDDESVAFISNKSEFIDASAAREILVPIADVLIKHPGAQIVLAGSTASTGVAENCRKLSLARADAVKSVLVELGVPEDMIITIGLGREENFLRVDDLDETGSLTADAAKNRAVFLFLKDSETARKLGIES